jgi:hypothetical protein
MQVGQGLHQAWASPAMAPEYEIPMRLGSTSGTSFWSKMIGALTRLW